jgi:UDP-N-acetylglucosamine acyltransferase
VLVEDWVVISGGAASHHYVTFGKHSFVGGLSAITRDVPPCMVVEGHPAIVRGVNRNGLKRRGFDEQRLDQLKTAWKMLFSDTTPLITQAVELEKMYPDAEDIRTLLSFMRLSMTGKFGRAREAQRGTFLREDNDGETPHATGN